jgi:hypothetical protein
MNLQLRKFDMSQIRGDEVIVLIGKRRTGKSVLIRDILYHKRDIPVGAVINPTEIANRNYSEIVPPIFVHDEYSPPILEKLIKRQRRLKQMVQRGQTDIDLRTYLIMDDCLYDNSWTKDTNIRNVFMNGRHYKILFLLAMQYALGVPPNLRTNIDYIFIFREAILSNRRRLFEQYAGMFPTFEVFCTVMDQCTQNFECLVINNNASSDRIEDQVYWYKADQHPGFRVGPETVWRYSEQNYQEDEPEQDETAFNGDAFQRRKIPTLNVRKVAAGGSGSAGSAGSV